MVENMVRLAGFEPATCCSGGNRSIHLSYRRAQRKVYSAAEGRSSWVDLYADQNVLQPFHIPGALIGNLSGRRSSLGMLGAQDGRTVKPRLVKLERH